MMRFIPPMALLVIVLALCRRTKHVGARDARWRGKMPVSISLSVPDLRETTALIGIDD